MPLRAIVKLLIMRAPKNQQAREMLAELELELGFEEAMQIYEAGSEQYRRVLERLKDA